MRIISLCFCILHSVCIVHAFQASNSYTLSIQAQDSITIKGRFIWKDRSITGYPSNVKITSTVTPREQFIQQVDSLGVFEKTLPYGKYIISPELNYHWMDEEFIRINDKKSSLEINVNADSKNEITISLDTISWPKKNFKSGILNATGKIDYTAIDQFMLERMKFFEIPGATLSLIKDNKIIYSQIYGVTNLNTKHPVTSRTLFEAGSITKLVFAFAVMRLYEKGKIDLDKPLHQYFPSPDIDDERYRLMTARHVLSHQSGLSNWPKKDANGKFKLNFTPGTQYGYSGQAYEYLKEAIEKITSKGIDVVLEEEVLETLQLDDMYFKGNDIIMKHGANGHKKYIPSDILLARRTMVSYSLQTTSQALAKFAIALNQRKGLKKETYNELFKVYSKREDGTEWGLGVRIEKTSSGISYGHSGSTDRGFISNLVFYKDRELGFTVLTNSQMGGWLSLPLLNEYLILGNAKVSDN
jgi:CubicO group peptidase (beta-lactamase class C family)